jgi:arginyl-tRNA synthetase
LSVSSLASLVGAQITAALPGTAAAPATAGFDPQVRASDHADLQANGVIALARRQGTSARALAAEVAGAVPGATVAGPGFLNITFAGETLWQQVGRRLSDPRLGVGTPETGIRSIVDYSHPNIAKQMHVGHLRSTIIGDALARMLGFLGGTVIRQNHLGDWGTQFGMLIEQRLERGTVEDLYRIARARFVAEPEFAERARRRVVDLQAGGAASTAIWRELVAESTTHFTTVYRRLGVLLTAGDNAGESTYNPMLAAVAQALEEAGIARRSDGALCVFFAEDPPLIVRKSDGGFGYAATDLAAIRHRVDDLHADRILYVVDARQALHFRQVLATARRAGWLPPAVDAVHVPFGTMLGADGRPFKSREGDTVGILSLLDAAVGRARSVVAAKSPGLDGLRLDRRAEEVGIGALKYFELSTNRTKDYAFDLDRMLSLTGDTGVYLQYAHARLRSILAKAGAQELSDQSVDPAVPPTAQERRLILELDRFGDVVVEAVAAAEPHQLCGYLARLAQTLTAFYGACPVLAAPPAVRQNRLALCGLTAQTLRGGLDLLGIATPNRL